MIILKGKNNEVAFMTIVGNANKDEAIKKFKEVHPGYIEVEGEFELPDNRQFRDAWIIKNNKIVIDKTKAKEIHLNRLRIVRDKKLEELDREQLKYLTNPLKLEELEWKKQKLRDIPKNYKEFDVDNPYIPPELQ